MKNVIIGSLIAALLSLSGNLPAELQEKINDLNYPNPTVNAYDPDTPEP